MINHYQILDLQDYATPEEIRQAYRAKCKQYHPDLVHKLGPKLQMLARREMAKVNFAHQTLGDPEAKAKFDGWLRSVRSTETMKSCMICGIKFSDEDESYTSDVCPACIEVSEAQTLSSTQKEQSIDPESLLKTCFVTLHHFTASAVLKKIAPSINILVGESRMKIYGPPGPLKIMLDSKDLYDLVEPAPGITKHPWSRTNRIGTISFSETHPAEAAHTLWEFCLRTLGEPELRYCRIAVNNPEFTPYEATLGESVLMAHCSISPWTATRLYSRYQRNLAEAACDAEAAVYDPFFNVMTRPNNKEKLAELEHIRRRNMMLEQDLENANRKIDTQTFELDERNSAVAELLRHLAELEPLKKLSETTHTDLAERNSTIVELLTNIEEIWQEIFTFFETYKEFSAEVTHEELQVQDLGVIFENMYREIQTLRAKDRKEREAREEKDADILPLFRQHAAALELDTKTLWKNYVRKKDPK